MKKNIQQAEEKFLTTAQAAALLNISVSTLKKFIFQGRIKTLQTPGGHYRLRKKDLLEKLYR